MRERSTATAARNRLLPEGRMTGPMPWVIAIMMFLTIIAGAAGLGLGNGVLRMQAQLAGKLTVQMIEPNAERRNILTRQLVSALRADHRVVSVQAVPESELAAQLRPWLGEDMAALDLPTPALIDVTLRPGTNATDIRTLVSRIAAQARLDADASFLAPIAQLMQSMMWLAALSVLLMMIATGAVVVLAARGAHDANRDTIGILHLLGSTDTQIARLFQRRMALDTLFGGSIGFFAAMVVLWAIAARLDATGSELVQLASLPSWGWAVLPLVPLLGVLLATATARLTVRRTLERSL